MRMIGVSWLTKDWIASVRFTFGFRSTIRASTRTIFAMARPYAAALEWMKPMIAWLTRS